MHFSLAYYLQSQIDADFFGITDINLKPKKFFEDQKLVDFKKNWYFHDHIDLNQKKPDIEYLMNFEKKYKINLWKLVINERFFYDHNGFYKFQKEEILSILEQELKLFETILDEVKPDYFLTYDPVLHHQKLLLDMCKIRGVKILSIYLTGIEDKIIIGENGSTLDLDNNSLENVIENTTTKLNNDKKNYDFVINSYLKNKTPKFSNKIKALISYLSNDDSELVKTNYMYYGRSKFKVIKDTINFELNKKKRFSFLQKASVLSPLLNIPYVYFPMNVNEEMNILHYAPYFTNQIEVIRHIAKSIPIDYVLYVKDHVAAEMRGWNKINYYKEIIEIPNVKLIHPYFDNNILLKNSQLLISIRGTTAFKAVKYSKPSIIFGDQPIEIIPSIFKVNSLLDLPTLIQKALKSKVDPTYFEKYEQLIDSKSIKFNMFNYENLRNTAFFAGGILSNVEIHEKNMLNFLEKNETMFSILVNNHVKLLS
jgi:hypothetical protein